MAQGPFQRAIQRIANSLGVLLPAQRAIRVASPLTVVDVPETQAGSTLRGASGDGEVTGYTLIGLDTSLLPGIVTSRIIAGTSPIRINGGDSADLGATNITVTIEPATTVSPGSMSAADKALLAAATPNPTINTIPLRDGNGEFGVLGLWFGNAPSSAGQLRCSDGFAATCDNGSGNDVNLLKCTTGAIEIGDTTRAESVTIFAKANGSIAAIGQGTGTVGLTALGAAAKISVISNSVENLHAEAGLLTITSSAALTIKSATGEFDFNDGTTDILSISKNPSTVIITSDRDVSLNGTAFLTLNGGSGGTQSRVEIADTGYVGIQVNNAEVARFITTSLRFPITQDATIDVASVAAGDGKNLILNAGNVTAGGGSGGSFALISGTNPGGPSGNVVCVMPFGSGGVSGMFKLTDGTNVFLDVYATAALTSLIGDRATTLNITSGALTLSAADNVIVDCGAGDLILFKVGGTEVARFDAGGPPAPQSVGAANSAGTGTELALASHVHAHAWQKELGANTLTGTTTTRYLATGYEAGTASANVLDMPVTKAFKADSLRMLARVGGTAGQTITGTLRKNGASVGAAALATASDATSGSSTFTAVSYAAGDTWGFQVDKSGAIATSPADIFWSVGCTPP